MIKNVVLAGVLAVSLIGCSVHGMRSETGNPITLGKFLITGKEVLEVNTRIQLKVLF